MKKKLPVIIAVVLIIVIIAITAGDEDSGTFLLFQREDGPECILWFGNGGGCGPRIK